MTATSRRAPAFLSALRRRHVERALFEQFRRALERLASRVTVARG